MISEYFILEGCPAIPVSKVCEISLPVEVESDSFHTIKVLDQVEDCECCIDSGNI